MNTRESWGAAKSWKSALAEYNTTYNMKYLLGSLVKNDHHDIIQIDEKEDRI